MLSCVRKAELRSFHLLLDVRMLGQVNLVGLNAFGPPNVVQALSEENREGKHHLVEDWVRLQRYLVEIHCEGLIDHHLVSCRFVQVHI